MSMSLNALPQGKYVPLTRCYQDEDIIQTSQYETLRSKWINIFECNFDLRYLNYHGCRLFFTRQVLGVRMLCEAHFEQVLVCQTSLPTERIAEEEKEAQATGSG